MEQPHLSPILNFLVAMLLLLFLLHLVATKWIMARMQTKKPFPELPMPLKGNHWLFGHMKTLYGGDSEFPHSILRVQKQSANAYGQTGYWITNKRVVCTTDLQDARTILWKEYRRETVPILGRFVFRVLGENALILLNGRAWKLHRDSIIRTFSVDFLKHAQGQIQQVAHDLVSTLHRIIEEDANNCWEGNVQPICKHATMDVFGKAAFGIDFGGCKTLTSSPLVETFEHLCVDLTNRLEYPLAPWNYFFGLPTQKNRRQRRHFLYLRNFIQQLLDKEEGEQQNTLLSRLVQAHHNKEGDRSDEAIKDVMSTLLFAGYDTTSTTLTFSLYLLANHPDIQDTCLEEIQQLSEAELSDPDKLQYTAAVVKETLRLYPAAFQTSRTLTKPIRLKGGFEAPAGVHVAIPILVIQRDEAIFPHADECRPERWVEKRGSSTKWTERSYSNDKKTRNRAFVIFFGGWYENSSWESRCHIGIFSGR